MKKIRLSPVQKVIVAVLASLAGAIFGHLFFVYAASTNLMSILLMVVLSMALFLVLRLKRFKQTKLNVQIKLTPEKKIMIFIFSVLLGFYMGYFYLDYDLSSQISLLLLE